MNKWYETTADLADVVISSRIRLARNLSNLRFSGRMSREETKNLLSSAGECTSLLKEKENMNYYSCQINRLGEVERSALVEWHIISPQLAKKQEDTGLLLSEDEGVSIMVNEEDHLRIQTVAGGMNMKQALHRADQIDDLLSSKMPFAFDEKFGYLTTCPTNTGTGLRASYMLFLPALTMAGKLERLEEEVGKYGVTIRGIYGEGTKGLGFIYQVSNQKTLGSSEAEILENLDQIVLQIIKLERKRREYMLMVNREEITDKVYRSYGILKYAKLLNTVDAMTLLSQVKLGADTGLIKLEGRPNFHRMMMEIQPASIQKHYGKSIGNGDRDRVRAEYLNQRIPELKSS